MQIVNETNNFTGCVQLYSVCIAEYLEQAEDAMRNLLCGATVDECMAAFDKLQDETLVEWRRISGGLSCILVMPGNPEIPWFFGTD